MSATLALMASCVNARTDGEVSTVMVRRLQLDRPSRGELTDRSVSIGQGLRSIQTSLVDRRWQRHRCR